MSPFWNLVATLASGVLTIYVAAWMARAYQEYLVGLAGYHERLKRRPMRDTFAYVGVTLASALIGSLMICSYLVIVAAQLASRSPGPAWLVDTSLSVALAGGIVVAACWHHLFEFWRG